MADFITLTCPSCGSKLQLTNDIERFSCGSCGNEHFVRRSGGIVSLAPVVAHIQKVQVGVDKTASELAIKRLLMEIQGLHQQRREIKASNQGYILARSFGGIVAGGVAWLILAQFVSGEDGLCFGLLVFFFISAVGIVWGIDKQNKVNASEYLPIDHEIQIRQQELRRHKHIVSS